VFDLRRIGRDVRCRQDDAQKQPVAVVAAEQVGVLALPAQPGPLGQRFLHQGGGVDEHLNLGAQQGRDLARQGLQPPLDDLMIVVPARINRDIAA